jgi:cell wall-associated NlpC family hydrolase
MYTRDWHLHNSTELLMQGIEALGGLRVALSAIQPGDILLFRYAHAASHAGILLPGPRLIHAKRQAGRVICHRFTLAAHPELDAAYVFPGVE